MSHIAVLHRHSAPDAVTLVAVAACNIRVSLRPNVRCIARWLMHDITLAVSPRSLCCSIRRAMLFGPVRRIRDLRRLRSCVIPRTLGARG